MLKRATLATLVAVSIIIGTGLNALGQSPAAKAAVGVPTFQADANWPPALPNNWVMGSVSSVAIDRRDHAWILHRPRTVPDADKKRAAPAVLEFDAAGKFVQGWGGPATGYEWPDDEHGIYVDDKDVVWIRRERRDRGRLPPGTVARRRHAAQVHESGKVSAADRSSRADGWKQRHEKPERARRRSPVSQDQRAFCRRRVRESPG